MHHYHDNCLCILSFKPNSFAPEWKLKKKPTRCYLWFYYSLLAIIYGQNMNMTSTCQTVAENCRLADCCRVYFCCVTGCQIYPYWEPVSKAYHRDQHKFDRDPFSVWFYRPALLSTTLIFPGYGCIFVTRLHLSPCTVFGFSRCR